MDLEILIIASFVVLIILFVHMGRKSVRLEQELKDRINEELSQYGLKAGISPIRPWYIGRNDQNRMGFLIRTKNNAVAEKIIFDYNSVRYAALEIDGHLDASGLMPGNAANLPADAAPSSPDLKKGTPGGQKAALGAQEYRNTQKRIGRATFSVYFNDGKNTSINLNNPYNSVLGNLINIYNFFAAQAACNSNPAQGTIANADSSENR